jgi:DNA repair protein RadD
LLGVAVRIWKDRYRRSHYILSALSKCRRVLFLAHRRELINQCADKLKALGVLDYNVILPRHPQSNNPTSQMHIASIQTLIRREYPKADLIIVDECHHAVGRQYQSLLSNYPNSYVLGLTATPERLDGKGLDDIFQDLLEVATVPQLIEQGFLVKPTCLSPSIEMAEKIKESLSGLKIRGGDYDEGELGDAMDNKVLIGDIIEHWKEWAFGQKNHCVCSIHYA